jgi:hypothetical protein
MTGTDVVTAVAVGQRQRLCSGSGSGVRMLTWFYLSFFILCGTCIVVKSVLKWWKASEPDLSLSLSHWHHTTAPAISYDTYNMVYDRALYLYVLYTARSYYIPTSTSILLY